MAASKESSGKDALGAASTNLSQLVARILNQLALSAWLPSAALVLLLAFIFQLGTILDTAQTRTMIAAANHQPPIVLHPMDAVAQALERLGATRAGSLVLMLSTVVVLTMLTQAFSFESIRILEGYWGTNRLVEQIARSRCAYYRWIQRRLKRRLAGLTAKAWETAELAIRAEQTRLRKPELSDAMIRKLASQVLNEPSGITLSRKEQAAVASYDWQLHAPVELLRRVTNVEKRMEDFPEEAHVQPTRLGNVMRRFEDETEVAAVESLVEDVFDRLPFTLQVSHDEQRGRLDLYCSMTFVWVFVAGVGLIRLGWRDHLKYSVAATVVCLISAWFTYRAAVASARYYGLLLNHISKYRDMDRDDDATPHGRRFTERLRGALSRR
jgi:hypothetical protein